MNIVPVLLLEVSLKSALQLLKILCRFCRMGQLVRSRPIKVHTRNVKGFPTQSCSTMIRTQGNVLLCVHDQWHKTGSGPCCPWVVLAWKPVNQDVQLSPDGCFIGDLG